MSDFTPNPLYSYGRIDTSAGEGGESLHKVAPHVFGVGDGKLAEGIAQGAPATSEDIVLQPTSNDASASGVSPDSLTGTVDTTGHGMGGFNHEQLNPAAHASVIGDGSAVVESEAEVGDELEAAKAALLEVGVEKLREMAKERGVSAGGSKEAIIDRIIEHDTTPAPAEDDDEPTE